MPIRRGGPTLLAFATAATLAGGCRAREAEPRGASAAPAGPVPDVRRVAAASTVAAAPEAAPESIEALLAAVAAGKEGDHLPARLEAMLLGGNDAVPAALAFVREGRASKPVIDALAAAGTVDAQAGLCALARDRALPTHVRTEAVASLVLVKRPTPATLRALAVLVQTSDAEPRRAALFVAGAVARAARTELRGPSAALEKAVLAEYGRTPGADDHVDGLAALGNLGSTAILPRVRAALGSSQPSVRAAAVRALRLVPAPEADRLLVATLHRDREATVRAAAIFAAGFRAITPLAEAVAETAETDPVEYVRANAVTLLAHHADASPRIGRALSFVAENDPAPEVRRLARGPHQDLP